MGWRTEREVPGLRCYRGTATHVAGCPFQSTENDQSEGESTLNKMGMKDRRNDYAELRAIPSLCTRFWSVDRFIPRRAAAP